jgi:bifunctional non-homologous end joining protein LigD
VAQAVVLDLDPPTLEAARIVPRVAIRLRDVLTGEGLESFVKTSGASGLHVYVPIGGTADFAHCKRFAREIAARLAAEDPDRVTDSISPRGREGRLLVDWTRMSERATIAAPYSLRALRRPSVSVPLRWDELEGPGAPGLWFEPDDVFERTDSVGDPFAPAATMSQALPAP